MEVTNPGHVLMMMTVPGERGRGGCGGALGREVHDVLGRGGGRGGSGRFSNILESLSTRTEIVQGRE